MRSDRVASRYLQSRIRTACIVAAGTFGDSYCLVKNRDRNYVPKIRIVHEIRDGVEVAYMKDDFTSWVEGINEFGIGIVNAALMVSRDESERDEVERTGKKLLDGDRILKALESKTVAAAAKSVRTYQEGLKGHTIISDGKKSYYVEMPDSNEIEYDKIPLDELFVRTNHGVDFPDAGYVEGPREESSKSRQEEAEQVLAEVLDPNDAAPALLRAREDRWEPTEMVRDSKSPRKMRTTSQMVLDLSQKKLTLYLLPGRVDWGGLKVDLPKDYAPKITIEVREYKDLSEDTEAETRKKRVGSLLPIMDPAYNIREVYKQLVLLEDHLFHPRKHCSDCIWKHLLMAEGLAEEASTLDVTSTHAGLLMGLGDQIRQIQRAMQEKLPPQFLAQRVREIRKGLLPIASQVRVAHLWASKIAEGKYKEKKEVPKADGSGTTTVYVYGPRQVSNRNKAKAERVEKLRHSMTDLRKQVRKDLDAKDDKTRLTALAIALIDATFERVGNDDSAEDGHFGVTGWLKQHLTFGKGKATIKYVGKSGVKHEKVVEDAKLVKALKGCCENKSPEDPILSFGAEDKDGVVKITSRDVNTYLKPFDVTAKDLRGFHANREMQDQLRALRLKGPDLPHGRKDKDKILKEEFKKALEATAEAVGHEAATLRTQYLVPGLEDAYMKDGTVIDNLKDASASSTSSRVAEAWLHREATKSQSEREDEEAARLVRSSPKQKPPRSDSKRNRVQTEDDPDLSSKDKDMSLNYKDVGG